LKYCGGTNVGGGTYNAGVLTLDQSNVNSNTAFHGGGDVYNDYSASLTLIDSALAISKISDLSRQSSAAKAERSPPFEV